MKTETTSKLARRFARIAALRDRTPSLNTARRCDCRLSAILRAIRSAQ